MKQNLTLILLFVIHLPLFAQQPDKKQANFATVATASEQSTTLMNINNLSLWIRADGWSGRNPLTGESGIIYPRGTAPVVFQDGILWGGLVRDGQSPELRVGGQTYNSGTVAGRIISRGIREDTSDPDVNRIWRIRRDFATADLKRDAAELFHKSVEYVAPTDEAELRALYARDWREWPAEKGAPFYDANGDGMYTPEFSTDGRPVLFPEADEPGLADADQVVWLVANDLDSAAVRELSGSPPIGLEMQMTLWGYNRNDALGNVIFKRARLIYKGTADASENARIDSLYLAQWSNPELGTYTDDFVGCDPALNLEYVYNSSSQDELYEPFDLPPPAFGYDILAGPIVPKDGEQATFDLTRRTEFKNLPMTSFVYFAAGASFADPCFYANYQCTFEWWNTLRGFLPGSLPDNPEPWTNTITGEPTFFPFSGDPVLELGDRDGISLWPGNRRMSAHSGPFTMALGDTNEITIALVGGLGSDRLTSISVMKYYARVAQQVHDRLFEMPQLPPTPAVTASALDREVILNWGHEQQEVERVEQFEDGQFRFEGYNIYQLPAGEATLANAVRLATFDLKNDAATIVEEIFDPEVGAFLTEVVQFGSNSGLSHSLLIEEDAINDKPLNNGQTYTFAVTSYSYNSDPLDPTKALESQPAVVTVTPQSTDPGVTFNSTIGDTLPVSHAEGLSTGQVFPVVVDPTKVTGEDYRITFSQNDDDGKRWHLVSTTTGDTLLQNQTTFSEEDVFLIIEGIQVKLMDAGRDFQRTADGSPAFIEVANENGPLTASDLDEQGAPFGGNLVWHSKNAPSSGDRYFLSTTTFGESGMRPNFRELLHNNYELRFTTLEDGSWGWWVFTSGDVGEVPFQIWDTGVGTPDDPSDDIRMIPILFEGSGTSGEYTPDHGPEGAFGFASFDRIYWYYPWESYEIYEADASDGQLQQDHTGDEVLGRLMVADADSNGAPPLPGTIVRIITTKPFDPRDVYTFTTSGYEPTFSRERARDDVEAVNVFPNPYNEVTRLSPGPETRRMTFNHLPQTAIIRIFTLAGHLVKTIEKNDDGQFAHWDLHNDQGKLVASGIYLAHVEMPDLNTSKILKLIVMLR